jgi:hypothetical protein
MNSNPLLLLLGVPNVVRLPRLEGGDKERHGPTLGWVILSRRGTVSGTVLSRFVGFDMSVLIHTPSEDLRFPSSPPALLPSPDSCTTDVPLLRDQNLMTHDTLTFINLTEVDLGLVTLCTCTCVYVWVRSVETGRVRELGATLFWVFSF